ncbi:MULTISPECIES: hypothetical protein [unclassified Streptomyces]|uniref:hypothetical protein n=1 Tax=unclassified Streptomyces TaxID=2593676 RepID=UPI003411BDAD
MKTTATEYRVTFDRIGRRGGRDGSTPPSPIIRSFGGEQLANSIALHARPFIASRAFEVIVDMDAMNGFILAGFHTAGTFTIEALSLPTQQATRPVRWWRREC